MSSPFARRTARLVSFAVLVGACSSGGAGALSGEDGGPNGTAGASDDDASTENVALDGDVAPDAGRARDAAADARVTDARSDARVSDAAGADVVTCKPSCLGKQCGEDGCGGSCGTCSSGTCNASGLCQTGTCTPSCTNKTCWDDGCGGSCGTCSEGTCNSFGFCGGAVCGNVTCGSHAACCRCNGQVLGCFGFTPGGKCSDYGPGCTGGN